MLYDYICSNCNHRWDDVKQSIKDKPKKKCSECGKHTLERVIYGGAYGFTKNVSTIGQLADKNTSDMGHYQRSEMEAKANASRPNHDPSQATSKEIFKMTHEQKQRYIMEGKK
jgi:putative FmdB family regulatory protein